MKKITLLQSAFALIAAFMLALPARAQVASAADLFGTYKFTADVNVTDAGQALKDNFKEECDVKITKCSIGIYDGEIQGLAGATSAQSIYSVDTEKNVIIIRNPNGNGLWGGGLYMSNAEGGYPFAQENPYSDIEYTFDPTTKTITLPNFTLVTCDHANSAATIMVSYTNAKLTLVEAENVNVTDLSGDWHFTAATGGYNTMENSTLPTEWDMTLTATDDTKKAYNISLTLGDFAPLALTATFDGAQLTIPFNETYFDAEQKIGIVNMYGTARPGEITFNMANENLLTLTSGMTIAQDSISPEVKGGYMQWYMAGSAKRESGEVSAFTWEGTYKVKAGSIMKNITDYEYPEEFDMVVAYNADYDIYYITNFLGYDVAGLNYGGISFTLDDKNANKAYIKVGSFLKTIEQGKSYLSLADMNASTASPIEVTRNEDGTFSISDFCVTVMTYNDDWSQKHTFAAFYQNTTATQEVIVPFTWAGTFQFNVQNITVYNDAFEFPNTFEMEVSYLADYDIYLVTKFLGNDVASLNYGGISFTIDENNPNKAEIKTGSYLKTITAGESYLCLMDMNATSTSKISVTRNEDGTITMSDFCVTNMTYDANWNQSHTAAALYTGVTTAAIEEEVKPFSWEGTFNVKAENVTIYNNAFEYPTEFEMEVSYLADYGIYLVTKFFGNDVSALNYGGISFTIDENNPNKAEIKTGSYLKTITAGESYLCLMDMNATSTSKISVTRNEDGTITMSDFCVTNMTYDANWNQSHAAAAFYSGVKAEKGASSIEENVVNTPVLKAWSSNGVIYVAGEAQEIDVYDMSGRIVFSGIASQVNGLNKGLYLVKVKNAVAKVAVK